MWEFNHCIKAYNRKQNAAERERVATAWQTGAFAGAAFNGKLRKLNNYLKDKESVKAPKVSKEKFEAAAKAAERRRHGGT
ncbi:MAG: hypothetical protein FH749_07830 [Firmicutes bacterium]|nr:hypothetical protein [Bacillota bacterium]